MKKIQQWFLAIIFFSVFFETLFITILASGIRLGWLINLCGIGGVINFFILMIVVIIWSMTVNEKYFYSTYDELRIKLKETTHEYESWKKAEGILSNHIILKYLKDNNGSNQNRKMLIYKRKK